MFSFPCPQDLLPLPPPITLFLHKKRILSSAPPTTTNFPATCITTMSTPRINKRSQGSTAQQQSTKGSSRRMIRVTPLKENTTTNTTTTPTQGANNKTARGDNKNDGFDVHDPQWSRIYATFLSQSPTRSITINMGDPNRQYLGENGTFEVWRNSSTLQIYVRHISKSGKLTFLAEVIYPRELSKQVIFATEGEEIAMNWDACNEAFEGFLRGAVKGSTTPVVGLRRFTFRFQSIPHLYTVLLYMFRHDAELVQEFFTRGSRFYEGEETRPPHLFAADMMMPVAAHHSHRPVRRILYTTEEEMGQKYGMNPWEESCVP